MGRFMLGMVAGLLLGLGLGALLPDGKVAAVELVAPQREAQVPMRLAELEVPSPAVESRSVAGVHEPTLQGHTPAARSVDVVASAPALVEHDGTIVGVVLDSSGRGIEGVLVRARRYVRSRIRSVDSVGQDALSESLESQLGALARAYADERDGSREARTNALGEFVLTDIAAGDFMVNAFKRGLIIARPGRLSEKVTAGCRVRFVARPVIEVEIHVLLPDGAPAPEAVVSCRELGSERRDGELFAWSPGEDVLRLPRGRFTLFGMVGAFTRSSAPIDELAEMRSQPVEVDLTQGAPSEALVLRLEGHNGIRGRVILPDDGLQGGYATVRILAMRAGEQADLSALAASDGSINLWRRTSYSVQEIPPGCYAVGVTRGRGGPVVAHEVVNVTSEVVHCDFEVPPIDPSGYLVVRTIDGSGQAVDEVRFQVGHRRGDGSGSSQIHATAMRAEDGSYYIGLAATVNAAYRGENAGGDTFSIVAEHLEYGTRTVELKAGQAQVEIRFDEPARLEVHLSGLATDQFARAQVSLIKAGQGPNSGVSWTDDNPTPPDGIKRFQSLEPGTYHVRLGLALLAGRGLFARNWVTNVEVDLSSGSNVVNVAVPPLYGLNVEVLDGEEGEPLSLIGLPGGLDAHDIPTWRAKCGADGRVRFSDLPAGEYALVHNQGEGARQMQIVLPCGDLVFTPDEE